MMTLQHGLKIGVFGVLGFNFGPYLLLLCVLLLCGMLGTALGRVALLKINESTFRKILNIVLVVIAGRLVWSATALLLGESNG